MAGSAPILVAEDEENDFFLLRYAFEEAGIRHPLFRCPDGSLAIDYLAGLNRYTDRQHFPLPCLVVTDLKMPRTGGLELLKWMRVHTPAIPVVVLSSSSLEIDFASALALGASAYYVKPCDLQQLLCWARLVRRFWLRHADSCDA